MLDDYGFGYLALVLRIKADCSRAKTRFHPGYQLFLQSPLCELEHLVRCFKASKFAQLLRQTVNRCRRGFR